MVQNFHMASSRSTTGYFAGLLTGMMMLGRTITSPFWGWFIDNYGRKPTLVFGISATVVLSAAFGFVVNFWMAMAIRFVLGLLAPLNLVNKTYIAEIAPERLQAQVASLYASCWLVGNVLGLIIGGLLVEPAKTGLAPDSFFEDWPYVLPNLLCAAMGFVSLVGVVIYVDETLKKKEPSLNPSSSPERSSWELLKDRQVCLMTVLYGLNTFTYTGFTELIPLWCWASRDNHGLQFSPAQISYALAAANCVLVVTQQFTFKYLAKKQGLKWCNTWSSLAMAPIAFAMPWIAYTSNPVGIWIYIIVFIFLFMITNFTALTAQLVLSNNVVLIAERGRLNGLLIFCGSLLRALAPTTMGVVFASTNASGLPFPLDFTFCFTLLAVASVGTWILARRVSIELQRPKDARTEVVIKTMGGKDVRSSLLGLRASRSSFMTETGYFQYDEDEGGIVDDDSLQDQIND